MATKISDRVKELIAEKDGIESEIKELLDVLESQGAVGMTEKLVDSEDFPRNDIDVHTVRTVRQKVIYLQNDHKALMKEIEGGLHDIHASAKHMQADERMDTSEGADISKAFLKVDQVTEGSPASVAGIRVDDLVAEFGSVKKDNFRNLQDVGTVVQHSIDKSLRISLIRNGQKVTVSLVPQKWSGRGSLGCNVVPWKS